MAREAGERPERQRRTGAIEFHATEHSRVDLRLARRRAARRAYGCMGLAVPSESAGSDPEGGTNHRGPEPQTEDLRCRQ